MTSLNKNRNYLIFMALILFLGTSILSFQILLEPYEKSLNNNSQPKRAEIHSKIVIIENFALDEFCAGNSTDGQSWDSAHVIENYEIDAGTSGSGILLENISRYLIIQNCSLTNSGSSSNAAGINFVNCTNVRIINCTITQNNGYGVNFNECSAIEILDTDIFDNSKTGIFLSHTNNSHISDSNVYLNDRYGIYMECNCQYNDLTGINASYNNWEGFLIYDSSNYNNFIDNNVSYNSYGVYLEISSGNTFINNVFSNNDYSGLEIYESNWTIVENNQIVNNKNGMEIWGGDGGNYNIISHNNFSFNTQDGIILDDTCQHNIITNNEICNNSDDGIYSTDNQYNNTFVENKISYNDGKGISISGVLEDKISSNSTIKNNIITNNDDWGIQFEYCNNHTIYSNLIQENYGGMNLYQSHNNSIFGNEILFNEEQGICIEDSNSSYISGNNASFNTFGVELENGNENVVWMNYLSNNSYSQGFDERETNSWDNGIVGNYWGDYTELYPDAIIEGMFWSFEYEINGTLTNDTLPLATLDPGLTIVSSGDLTYTYGDTGNTISWTLTDDVILIPEYSILLNNTKVSLGSWESGDQILINVDNLAIGNYSYKIIATDGTVWGEVQDIIEVEVEVEELLPDPPIIISTNQTIHESNFTIEWESVSSADSYNVYINGTLEGNTVLNEFTLESLENGEYIITVTTVNEIGESEFSEEIKIIVDLEDASSNKTLIYGIAGGGAFLIVAVVVVVILKKKKNK